MKGILVALALTMTGMFAHANDVNNDEMVAKGKLSWTCGLKFTGSSYGVKVVLGHFTTEATGTLGCVDLEGNHWSRRVHISMGSHFIGPVVGLGYFKFAGLSSEISLFNCSPDVLFGSYVVAHGQGAIIGGAGTFAAVRVKPPEIAVNIALKLVKGLGAQVGIEHLRITPM